MARAIKNPINLKTVPYNLSTALVVRMKGRCPKESIYPDQGEIRRFKAQYLTPINFTPEIADVANWGVWTLGGGWDYLADDAKDILGHPSPFIVAQPFTEVAWCGTSKYHWLDWDAGLKSIEVDQRADDREKITLPIGTIVLWWDIYEGAGWTERKLQEWHTRRLADCIVDYSGQQFGECTRIVRTIFDFALESPSYIAFAPRGVELE